MTIASINSVDEGSVASFNGVAKANIGTIDGQSFPADSVSLSSPSMFFNTLGEPLPDDWVIVYSSGNWTAAIIDDVFGMINTFTSSGSNNDLLQVTVFINSVIEDCHTATIRVTKGTATVDLTVYQDGTVLTCS